MSETPVNIVLEVQDSVIELRGEEING